MMAMVSGDDGWRWMVMEAVLAVIVAVEMGVQRDVGVMRTAVTAAMAPPSQHAHSWRWTRLEECSRGHA